MRSVSTTLLFSCLLAITTNAQSDAAPPDWVHEDMARSVGMWIGDNSEYQSEQEPFDQYGIEWSWGLGEKTLRGRLFGLKDGEEQGTFWEFIQFWDPAKQKVMVYQFGGDGTVGKGELEWVDEHSTRLLQTFTSLNGSSFTAGHRTTTDGSEQTGISFDVDADGNWTPRRSYLWIKRN